MPHGSVALSSSFTISRLMCVRSSNVRSSSILPISLRSAVCASCVSTRKTISASDIVASPSLLRLQPERQAVHPRHLAALPAPQRALAFVPRGPRRAAELRLADLARRQVVEQHGHLADEDIDARGGVVSRRDPAEQPPAERHEEPDRDEREEEPLDPSRSARSERCQHTDGDRAETEA